MHKVRIAQRQLTLWVLTVLCWTAMTSLALAAEDKKDEEGAPVPYLMPYVVVIGGIGLGMLLICRPSGREDRTKKEALPGSLTAEQLKGSQKKKGPQGPQRRGKEVSPDARNALTLSIIAAVLPLIGGLLLGPFALWKAAQARKSIKQNPRLTGDNLALAGMIVGILVAVLL
jgi:uncharacterized protein YneF (UPF0154 family)